MPPKKVTVEEPATNLRRSSRSTRGSIKPIVDLTKATNPELSDQEVEEVEVVKKKATKNKNTKKPLDDDQDIVDLAESSDEVEICNDDDDDDEDFDDGSDKKKSKPKKSAAKTPAKGSKTKKTADTESKGTAKKTAKSTPKPKVPEINHEEVEIFYELNEKEMKEVNTAFDMNCSRDGEEEMTSENLKTAIRSLGFEPRADEIQKLMKKFSNRNGLISRDGFHRIMAFKIGSTPGRNDNLDSNDDISKVFNLLDLDKTGLITIDNLKSIAKELNEEITEEELHEMVVEADLDGDLRINKEEFYNIMKKTSLY